MLHIRRYCAWIIIALLTLPSGGVHSQNENKLPFTMKWSPDGTMLAVGYEDGHFEIIDSNSLEQIANFTGHRALISDIDWSPDQHFIVTGSIDRTARIWDIDMENETIEIEGLPRAYVNVVAWRSEKNTIIVMQQGDGDNLFEWDFIEQTFVYSDIVWIPTAIAWNSIENKFAIGSLIYRVEIRDSTSMEVLQVLELDRPERTDNLVATGPVVMAWNMEGNYLLTGGLTGEVILWNVENEATVIEDVSSDKVDTTKHVIRSVWFNEVEDRIVSLAGDGTIRIWEIETGELISETQISEEVLVADVNVTDGLLAYIDGDLELHIVELSELDE